MGAEACYVGKQRHHRIPSADLPNIRKLSLCLLQYLADYHVPIRPGCNVSTTQNKMWHFSFTTGLHFLPVTFSVTPAWDRSIWHLLQGVLSAGPPMVEPQSTSGPSAWGSEHKGCGTESHPFSLSFGFVHVQIHFMIQSFIMIKLFFANSSHIQTSAPVSAG